MNILYQIRDEMTPKVDGGGIAFTLRSRDYKGVIAIVITERQDELLHRKRTVGAVAPSGEDRSVELYARSASDYRGG